jgi:hypothetical protein
MMDERQQQRRVRHRLSVLRHAEEISGNVVAIGTLCRNSSGERSGEFVSRVELQFVEDAREVTLDRARRDEEGLGDLAIGKSLAGEFGDAALAGCQRVEPCEYDPARARAGGAELGRRLLGERPGARAVGGLECLAKQCSSFAAAIAPPKQGAEVSEGTRPFQRGVTMLKGLDRLAEQ